MVNLKNLLCGLGVNETAVNGHYNGIYIYIYIYIIAYIGKHML